MSQIVLNEDDEEEEDPLTAKKIKSMSVYEMLQDPEKRFVLTNIRQFQDDTFEEAQTEEQITQ